MRSLPLVFIGLLAASPVLADSGPALPPAITVEGEASVSVVPDSAVISLGIVTERSNAADASAENSKAIAAVLEAVKTEGIDARDVRTSAVGLSAIYDNPSRGAPRITGFRASNDLQIRVRPIDKAGSLAGLLVDKGVNSIQNIEFVASPDGTREDQLRADAMRDARHKAEVYAEALGLKLGRVLGIATSGARPMPPQRMFHMAMAGAAAPVPLAAGSEEQRSDVSVTFEILQ